MAKSKAKAKVVKYVAIRECFDFGRLWLPMSKAVQEKDYLLQVGADVKVSEKNFMQVKDAPALSSQKHLKLRPFLRSRLRPVMNFWINL